MKIFFAVLALLAVLPAVADEAPLRPSAELLFKQPELLQSGSCVVYEEGGSGWIMTEPVYYLKGKVLAAEVRTRHLGVCPQVPGKTLAQYSRDEFNRQALASPCVSPGVPERDEQIGVVRLRVGEWETPYEKKAANAGRLYRGNFIDRKLEKGMELELEANLLGVCKS
ncbi:MAG: hypothetical protein WAV95_01910 [Azonexus sp.]